MGKPYEAGSPRSAQPAFRHWQPFDGPWRGSSSAYALIPFLNPKQKPVGTLIPGPQQYVK